METFLAKYWPWIVLGIIVVVVLVAAWLSSGSSSSSGATSTRQRPSDAPQTTAAHAVRPVSEPLRPTPPPTPPPQPPPLPPAKLNIHGIRRPSQPADPLPLAAPAEWGAQIPLPSSVSIKNGQEKCPICRLSIKMGYVNKGWARCGHTQKLIHGQCYESRNKVCPYCSEVEVMRIEGKGM